MSLAGAWLRGVWLGRALFLFASLLFGWMLWQWADTGGDNAPSAPSSAVIISVHSSPAAGKAGTVLRLARVRLPDGRETTLAVPANCALRGGEVLEVAVTQSARQEVRPYWPEHCAP
jgi:hypothetical protein